METRNGQRHDDKITEVDTCTSSLHRIGNNMSQQTEAPFEAARILNGRRVQEVHLGMPAETSRLCCLLPTGERQRQAFLIQYGTT